MLYYLRIGTRTNSIADYLIIYPLMKDSASRTGTARIMTTILLINCRENGSSRVINNIATVMTGLSYHHSLMNTNM